MRAILDWAAKDSLTVCGLMSGTSADGIDVAVCEFTGGLDDLSWRVVRSGQASYRSHVREVVARAPALTVAEVSWLDREVAEDFARAAVSLGLEDVDLVASHGQTLYHHSGATSVKNTLQVGCGDSLAVATYKPVVHSFRQKDVALGGEGAPLTPASDAVLYRDAVGEGGVLVNLGGIANVTVFGRTRAETRGFDTGPANCAIDRVVRRLTGGEVAFDADGLIARSGRVDEGWVEGMVATHPFVRQPPPKSTGFEAFGDAWVTSLGPATPDLVATLTAFSAACLAEGLRHAPATRRLVLAGGGAHNPFLVEQIRQRTGLEVLRSDEVGIPADSREAVAFALFGYLFARGTALDLRAVTGAKRPGVLGQLSLPT